MKKPGTALAPLNSRPVQVHGEVPIGKIDFD